MTSETIHITRLTKELSKYFLLSAEEALEVVRWSQQQVPDDWEVYAGGMAELANIVGRVEELLECDKSTFRWECLINGVWLPEIIAQDDL